MTGAPGSVPPGARVAGRALLLGVLILFGVNIVWIVRHGAALRALGPGRQAPAFDLESMSGGRVRLADLRGRVVLLDFWSVTCAPCKTALGHAQEVANRFSGEPVTVLAIHTRGGKRLQDDVRRVVSGLGLRLTVLLGDSRVTDRYTVRMLPTAILVDRRGRVSRVWRGITDADVLEKAIRELLPER